VTPLQLVERERRRLRGAYGAAGVALLLAVTVALLALGIIILGRARWIALPRALPFIVWGAVIALNAVLAVWAWRWVRRAVARPAVAAAIEHERALRAGSLRGVLEVGERGALAQRASKQLVARLPNGPSPLAPALYDRARTRAGGALGGASLAALVFAAVTIAYADGWSAITHPVRAWRGTLLPPLAIEGVPPHVVRGERLGALVIRAPGRRTVTLHQRATGRGWRSSIIAIDAAGRGPVTDNAPIDADLIMVATDGRTSSDTVIVHVGDRPFVGDVAMLARYPAYLGRGAEPLPTGEPARLPRGTVIEFRGRASTPLTTVRLAHDADTVAMRPDGRRFAGRLGVANGGRWEWLADGADGPIADVPAPLELDVIPDSAPRAEILTPAADTTIAVADRMTLEVAATDDHGLSGVVLRSWRQPAGAPNTPEMVQRLAADTTALWNTRLTLDLAPRELEPGDALHLVAVATDNSPWQQTGASRELVIRIPSLSERRSLARQTADSAVAHATAAASQQKKLEQRTGEAARARGQRSTAQKEANASAKGREASMSYEAAEQARSLAKEQRELAERVQQLQREAASLEQQLRRAGALDSALAAQLRVVQALLQQAMTPEMAKKMAELEQALQSLSGDEARRSLGELAQQQQRMREQLEKSVAMLKRAALEGTMQTLKDEARDIAQRERAVAESLAAKRADRGDARELADRSRALSEDVKRLGQRLAQEKAQASTEELRKARELANTSAEQMQKAADKQGRPGQQAQQGQEGQQGHPGREGQQGQQGRQTQQGQEGQQTDPRGGAQAARDAAQSMEQAAEQLAGARDKQIDAWKSELTQELDRSIQEMLQLAREEQQLETKVRAGAPPSSTRADQSALQQGVDKAAERLQSAGQKSALVSGRSHRAMAEARKRVGEATDQVSENRGSNGQAASAMRDAADALNQAASSLVRDRERANSASSASGFAEMIDQLQQLAKQQGALNAQAAGILQLPSGQSGEGMGQKARALGKQQRSLAQELQDLGDNEGGGRAEELAKEASQIAQSLESGRVDAATLERQQRLFRRLLDAGRTLEQDEREDDGKRESRSATGSETFTPDEGTASGRAATRFREPTWEELRGLSAEERRAVLEYFKRINAQTP
jgi:hypothetical protein